MENYNSSNGNVKPTFKTEDIANANFINNPTKAPTPDFWNYGNTNINYDLDRILGVPSDRINPKSNGDSTHMQDTFGDPGIGSIINMQGMFNNGSTLDFSQSVDSQQLMWPMSMAPANTMNFVSPGSLDNTKQQNTLLQYHSLSNPYMNLNTAPSSPDIQNSSTPQSPQESKEEPQQLRKKRGRKRRILGQDEQEEERKKFLERNRVAANRCRERRKEWVANLANKKDHLLYENDVMAREITRLEQEVVELRKLLITGCGCTAEELTKKMTAGVGAERPQWVVDGLVDQLKDMRTGSVDESLFGAREWDKRDSIANSAVSDVDSIFSPQKQMEDGGESSTQSSPETDGMGK